MSCSTLYGIFRTKASPIKEFQNGWGTGPMIWGYLNQRFLGGDFTLPIFSDMKPLWNLAYNTDVPEHLRITHAFTFDRAICKTGNVDRLIPALWEAYNDICKTGATRWSHFNVIAEAIKRNKPDHRLIGYGLSCTSVSDLWCGWDGKEDVPPWDIFEDIIDAKKAA